MNYDLIVIGGGPAGYVGAIRAGQLGKKVLCIDKERAGGTCLNWGCIPTKALLKSAELYETFKHAEEYGLTVKEVGFDFQKVIQRSRGVSDKMAKGIEFLFKGKKIDYVVGDATIEKDKKVNVKSSDGSLKSYTATHILIATGAKPRHLPSLPVDGEKVMTSREALVVKTLPKSIAIIGAGAIGVEFAYFFNAFGSKVTLLEMMPQILPVEDEESADFVKKDFVKKGIAVLTNTKVTAVKIGKEIELSLEGADQKSVTVERVLVAVGLQANLDGLIGEGLKLDLDERGYLKTSDRYETNVKGIYGAGDIIGPPWLAHVASHEAIEAVEGMFVAGKKPHKITLFPGCTYCQPQVASIGLTEKKAKEQKIAYKIGKFGYRASGKAVAAGHPEGFVKLIVGEKHGEVLGAHIVGADATEMIAELGLAMHLEATTDELRTMIHAHPTLSEMIGEAALATQGQAIHS